MYKMCVSFNKHSIYKYAFAIDDRTPNIPTSLSFENLMVFCKCLGTYISEQHSKNTEYKYVYFSGFDTNEESIYDGKDLLFMECINKVICFDQERLKDFPAQLEEKYRMAYNNDDTIPQALQYAKDRMIEFIKIPKNEEKQKTYKKINQS